MLNVICLWTGNKYPIEYVEKLNNMVKKNLTIEHRFICLTDKVNLHKIEGVEFLKAPIEIADSWCKLSLFHPYLDELGIKGKALYLDLDVVITGKLDGLVKKACKNDEVEGRALDGSPCKKEKPTFWIIKDWWRKGFNSSVIVFDLGKFNKIYARFKPTDMRRLKGDQDLINEVMEDSEVKTFGEVEVQSYKANNLQKGFKKETKIVVFHGKPKPCELKGSWVDEYWI